MQGLLSTLDGFPTNSRQPAGHAADTTGHNLQKPIHIGTGCLSEVGMLGAGCHSEVGLLGAGCLSEVGLLSNYR